MVKLDTRCWFDLVGVEYEHRGRGPEKFDCYGLLMEVFRRRGVVVPDVLYGSSVEEQDRILTEGAPGWRRVECAPGVGVMLKRQDGSKSHVGVMIDDDRFIHATEDHKQVVISRLSQGYARRVVGFYDYAA